ncbi:hypothetical protein [Campylobacter sp. MIT 97-5078]|uniref:hypothetical protein n=1 Tax=Campylobacter sp. MIT 97-5078 TaxID=1548153 RepID=UPI0005136299|nr:hypothetical protein [Campylobacter sp. MIT 97-5078]KGI57255.1 hypothetical protein LR59_00475 [Campylobacter sp. MIT 97-5078]TQR27419.1 hypothetical protein DMB91_03950 [Campylobacter sp. MIT 97-5078]
MKENKWVKFIPKSEQVAQILKQVPRGVRGTFIEQAILEFASKNPSISFHFDGITKPKRKRRTKEEMARDKVLKAEKAIQISSKTAVSPVKTQIYNEASDTKKRQGVSQGKMMFGFADIDK